MVVTYTKSMTLDPKDFGTCAVCANKFLKYREGTMFCSETCRKEHYRTPPSEIACVICGNKFVSKRNAKYCSNHCRNRRQPRRPLVRKNCERCGTEYQPITGSAKYCGSDCSIAVKREIQKVSKQTETSKQKTKDYNKKYKRYKDKRQMRDRNLRACYGISIEQFEEMESQQGGLCAICNKPPKDDKPLYVDHCHKTGKIRKLVCINCNNVLGNSYDNPKILRSAAEYIELYGGKSEKP